MSRSDMIARFSAIASNSVKESMSPAELRALKRQKEENERKEAATEMAKRDIAWAKGYLSKVESSRQRGIEFTLTFAEYSDLLSTTVCGYSGIELNYSNRTIERINPEIGYVAGNVIAVSAKANGQKSALDQFIKEVHISDEMKLKLLRKAAYQMEKKIKVK